jgi:hypothetical protein
MERRNIALGWTTPVTPPIRDILTVLTPSHDVKPLWGGNSELESIVLCA